MPAGETAAGGAASFAALALRAARRALASGELSDRRKRDSVRDTVPAPAIASKGWVIVASKARLRAARQSGQSLAPGALLRPQIWQLIGSPDPFLSPGASTRDGAMIPS